MHFINCIVCDSQSSEHICPALPYSPPSTPHPLHPNQDGPPNVHNGPLKPHRSFSNCSTPPTSSSALSTIHSLPPLVIFLRPRPSNLRLFPQFPALHPHRLHILPPARAHSTYISVSIMLHTLLHRVLPDLGSRPRTRPIGMLELW
jgi:hypothetical protein